MLKLMKRWSLGRTVRRKASTSKWSGRKKGFFRDRGNLLFFSSSWLWSCIFLSERRKWKSVAFSSKTQLPFLSDLLFSEILYDSFPADLDLCCWAARLHSKIGYSGLFPPLAFHRANQEPMGNPFMDSPSLKDEAGIYHFHRNYDIPFAWLLCDMLLLVHSQSYTGTRGTSKPLYKQTLP